MSLIPMYTDYWVGTLKEKYAPEWNSILVMRCYQAAEKGLLEFLCPTLEEVGGIKSGDMLLLTSSCISTTILGASSS